MGMQESKFEEELTVDVGLENTKFETPDVPTTPMATPIDPRSPSSTIARTPLEVMCLMAVFYSQLVFFLLVGFSAFGYST